MFRKLFTAAVAVSAFSVSAMALEDRVLTLPADYKTTFDNYLISDRLYQEDQVISLYASPDARAAARANGTLPDGSILVGEIYAAMKDADGDVIESPLGRRVPGALKAIVMMQRNGAWAAQYPDGQKAGGWEFEVFSPAGENLNKDTTACRECHDPLAETEFTWSLAHIAGGN